MSLVDASRVKKLLSQTIGPVPWYWESFPSFRSPAGQRFVWQHHGKEGPVAQLVTLGQEQEPEKIRLALNTYCRPFLVPPNSLGVWCPEGRTIRLACFNPDQLKAFDLAEVAGWFKQSSERIYSATAPVADFEIPLTLTAGTPRLTCLPPYRVSTS